MPRNFLRRIRELVASTTVEHLSLLSGTTSPRSNRSLHNRGSRFLSFSFNPAPRNKRTSMFDEEREGPLFWMHICREEKPSITPMVDPLGVGFIDVGVGFIGDQGDVEVWEGA
ncbi:hypothetical protein R6Q57_024762 [Mikania cordata]